MQHNSVLLFRDLHDIGCALFVERERTFIEYLPAAGRIERALIQHNGWLWLFGRGWNDIEHFGVEFVEKRIGVVKAHGRSQVSGLGSQVVRCLKFPKTGSTFYHSKWLDWSGITTAQ